MRKGFRSKCTELFSRSTPTGLSSSWLAAALKTKPKPPPVWVPSRRAQSSPRPARSPHSPARAPQPAAAQLEMAPLAANRCARGGRLSQSGSGTRLPPHVSSRRPGALVCVASAELVSGPQPVRVGQGGCGAAAAFCGLSRPLVFSVGCGSGAPERSHSAACWRQGSRKLRDNVERRAMALPAQAAGARLTESLSRARGGEPRSRCGRSLWVWRHGTYVPLHPGVLTTSPQEDKQLPRRHGT